MNNHFLRLLQLLTSQGNIFEPEPTPEETANTTYTDESQTLMDEDIRDDIISETGCYPGADNHSVHDLLNQREYNYSRIRSPANRSLDNTGPFSKKTQTHIMQRYFPNTNRLLKQSRDAIFCSQFSSAGDMFMSACKDSTITIYDTNSWKPIKTSRARDIGWSIISTDFSPDGRWLIYSSWSDYVHIINTSGEHETHESLDMRPNGGRFCLFSSKFSPDSREILGGSSDGFIYIYDIDRRERIERVGQHLDDINAVAYADDSNQIFFSGSDDSLIKVWDRRINGTKVGCIGVFPGHDRGITYIDSKRDGRYLISNGKDQCTKLWDIRSMQSEQDFPGRQSDWQYNSYAASHQAQNMPRNKRPTNDKSVMTYFGDQQILQTLIRCKFSPAYSTGQRYIYTGSADGVIYIFDVLSGKQVAALEGHSRCVRDMDWHPYLPMIASSSWDGTVKIWRFDSDPTPSESGPDDMISSSDDSGDNYY
jgi:WD repeat-containing protein 23